MPMRHDAGKLGGALSKFAVRPIGILQRLTVAGKAVTAIVVANQRDDAIFQGRRHQHFINHNRRPQAHRIHRQPLIDARKEQWEKKDRPTHCRRDGTNTPSTRTGSIEKICRLYSRLDRPSSEVLHSANEYPGERIPPPVPRGLWKFALRPNIRPAPRSHHPGAGTGESHW